MILKVGSSLAEFIRHLNDKFSLRCLIKNYDKKSVLISASKHSPSLVISKNITIKELVDFLKKFNQSINVLNFDGKQIPQHFTLEDGVNYIPPVTEKDELTKCLNIISSLQKTNLYNDIDWIIRLFEKAIFLSNTKKDKIAIINTLDEVISSNEKFTSSDYSKIVERLN